MSVEETRTELLKVIDRVVPHLDNQLEKRSWKRYLVVADTHGHLKVSEKAIELSLNYDTPVVFLGDYVDRGPKQIENLIYVLEHKCKRPDEVILLRGNHEMYEVNRMFGFYREVVSHFSEEIYNRIRAVFEKLPVAAVIQRDFLVHGGIAQGLKYIEEIQNLKPSDGRYKELLWNDPSEKNSGFADNIYRGGYKCYGYDVVRRFLEMNDLDCIVRGHRCYTEGYRYFFDNKVLSLYSIPNYCGNPGKYALKKEARFTLMDVDERSIF